MNQVIFNEIRNLKRQLLPNEKVILFGSQARGDAREDSDWDLLILLNKENRNLWEDSNMYGSPFDDLGWNHGIAINAIIYTKKQWENGKIFPLYRNVMREGIEIK